MIEIPITSNAAEVLQKMESLPGVMAKNIATAMDRENQLTIGHAQSKYLSGPRPQVLGVRSNRLRPSPSASKAAIIGNAIESIIGTNVAYAGVHEHGIDKDVQVKAHSRKNTRPAGRAAKTFDMQSGRISKAKKSAGAGAAVIEVKAFKRHMKMPARPYLAPSISDRKENYAGAISAALLASWQGGAGA
jgi:phage gpG-like protein